MNTSSKFYGLNTRTKLQEIDSEHLAIVKLVKSRIIQKDAIKILTSVDQINTISPDIKVSLMCHNNICSKSIKLLNDNQVDVIFV